MAVGGIGKKFEQKFKDDWLKNPGVSIDRLYDQTGGLVGIRNVSDFIGYKKPNIFYLETKSIKGNTFPLRNLTQYEALMEKTYIDGVRAGVVIYFYERDKVWYVPIITFDKIKRDGYKSINVKTLDTDKYYVIDVPSIKKRVYMDSDYSVLFHLPEDQEIKSLYNY